jgi:hypothetical protein
MASSAFAKAMEKKKNGSKLLQKAREAENMDFSVPEIEDGSYIVRVRAKVGVTAKKMVPYAEFRWTVVDESGYYGKGHKETFFLENEDLERLEKTFDRLGKTVKVLLGRQDIELESFDQLEEYIAEIDAARPHARVSLKNWEGKNGNGITAFFNERVVPQAETETAAMVEAPNEVDHVQVEIVEKGNTVIYDGEQYEVITSSPRNQTATLKAEDGTKVPNIAWTELEVIG